MYGVFVEVRGQPSGVRPHLPSPFETGYCFVFLPFACAGTSLPVRSGNSPVSTSHFAVGHRGTMPHPSLCHFWGPGLSSCAARTLTSETSPQLGIFSFVRQVS